eukprot:gene11490-12526_t
MENHLGDVSNSAYLHNTRYYQSLQNQVHKLLATIRTSLGKNRLSCLQTLHRLCLDPKHQHFLLLPQLQVVDCLLSLLHNLLNQTPLIIKIHDLSIKQCISGILSCLLALSQDLQSASSILTSVTSASVLVDLVNAPKIIEVPLMILDTEDSNEAQQLVLEEMEGTETILIDNPLITSDDRVMVMILFSNLSLLPNNHPILLSDQLGYFSFLKDQINRLFSPRNHNNNDDEDNELGEGELPSDLDIRPFRALRYLTHSMNEVTLSYLLMKNIHHELWKYLMFYFQEPLMIHVTENELSSENEAEYWEVINCFVNISNFNSLSSSSSGARVLYECGYLLHFIELFQQFQLVYQNIQDDDHPVMHLHYYHYHHQQQHYHPILINSLKLLMIIVNISISCIDLSCNNRKLIPSRPDHSSSPVIPNSLISLFQTALLPSLPYDYQELDLTQYEALFMAILDATICDNESIHIDFLYENGYEYGNLSIRTLLQFCKNLCLLDINYLSPAEEEKGEGEGEGEEGMNQVDENQIEIHTWKLYFLEHPYWFSYLYYLLELYINNDLGVRIINGHNFIIAGGGGKDLNTIESLLEIFLIISQYFYSSFPSPYFRFMEITNYCSNLSFEQKKKGGNSSGGGGDYRRFSVISDQNDLINSLRKILTIKEESQSLSHDSEVSLLLAPLISDRVVLLCQAIINTIVDGQASSHSPVMMELDDS